MSRTYAVVRPESLKLRGRTYTLVESLGYARGQGMVLPLGTPDAAAAKWLNGLSPDLIVLPYHLHKDSTGETVDGVGVALLLGEAFERNVPILMPVSGFSRQARLDARLLELHGRRPGIWRAVVTFAESEVGSTRLTSRILRAAGARPSAPPPAQSSLFPEAARHGLLQNGQSGEGLWASSPSIPPLEPPAQRESPGRASVERSRVEGRDEPLTSGYFPLGERPVEKKSGKG